jgi:hypothetical protein
MPRTLFGATGGTGTCLVERAPAAGQEITAVVRDLARLAVPAHQRLRSSPPTSRLGSDNAQPGADCHLTITAWLAWSVMSCKPRETVTTESCVVAP